MALSPFRKKLIIQLVIAVGIIAVLASSIIVLNNTSSKQVESIQAQKNQIALRNRTIELLAGGNSDLNRAGPLLANLQNVLPQKDQLIAFSREIKAKAKDYSVETGFSFGSETPATASDPGSVNFSLSVTGGYDAIVGYLEYLESHPYFIRFDGVSVGYQKDKQYNLTTSGVIYTK